MWTIEMKVWEVIWEEDEGKVVCTVMGEKGKDISILQSSLIPLLSPDFVWWRTTFYEKSQLHLLATKMPTHPQNPSRQKSNKEK
jgi:hypothetical protein